MTSDDEDDSAPHEFDQADCIEQFLNYLEELTENDTRYVTAISHNFKGYDSYFIVQRLIARRQNLDQTRTVSKLLQLTFRGGYVRFIDPCPPFPWPYRHSQKLSGSNRINFKRGIFLFYLTGRPMPIRRTLFPPKNIMPQKACQPLKSCPSRRGTTPKSPTTSSSSCVRNWGVTASLTCKS